MRSKPDSSHPKLSHPPPSLCPCPTLSSRLCPAGIGAQGRKGLLGFLRAFSNQGPEDPACNHWLPFSPRSKQFKTHGSGP